jgi:hypothetical protein
MRAMSWFSGICFIPFTLSFVLDSSGLPRGRATVSKIAAWCLQAYIDCILRTNDGS